MGTSTKLDQDATSIPSKKMGKNIQCFLPKQNRKNMDPPILLMTSNCCVFEAGTRSTLSTAFKLGNGLGRRTCYLRTAIDLGFLYSFYSVSPPFFVFTKNHSICAMASFPSCNPLCHLQGLHLFVLDNFRRRDQCKSCTS